MKVIANRQLRGEYGSVAPDEEFECREHTAAELLKSNLVRHARPPRVEYETKVIVPEAPAITPQAPEASPRQPFRDLPLSDAQSQDLAAEGDRVLPAADVSPSRAADPRGRGGRAGSRPRE